MNNFEQATIFERPLYMSNGFLAGGQDDIVQGVHKMLWSNYTLHADFTPTDLSQVVRIDCFVQKRSFPTGLLARQLPAQLHQLKHMTEDNYFNPLYFKRYGKPKYLTCPPKEINNTQTRTRTCKMSFKHNKVVRPGVDLSEEDEEALHDNLQGASAGLITLLQTDSGYLNRPLNSTFWMLISSNADSIATAPVIRCKRQVYWRDQQGANQ
jgi:hypothetical protein